MVAQGTTGNDLKLARGAHEDDHGAGAAFARFAHDLTLEQIPSQVAAQAKRVILDAVGVAFAAGKSEFANPAVEASRKRGPAAAEVHPIIGRVEPATVHIAAHINGMLIHGIDYDDTHLEGVVHVSSVVLPAVAAVATEEHTSGADALVAFIAGSEILARLGMAAEGTLNQVGLFPTSQLGIYAAAVASGRLRKLSVADLGHAQGLAGAMSSGSLEYLTQSSWTKPYQAGWASSSAITAVDFAARGFLAPQEPYEGRFGFYQRNVGRDGLSLRHTLTAELGRRWETQNIALKPYPACHMAHAFIQAALELRKTQRIPPEDIESIECSVAPGQTKTICEPWEAKQSAATFRERQFSLPYLVALALYEGDIKTEQLDSHYPDGARVAELASRVSYQTDDSSRFPAQYSGEVVVRLQNGTKYGRRVDSIRGSNEHPMTDAEVIDKFQTNVDALMTQQDREALAYDILHLEDCLDVADLVATWRKPS